MDKDMKLKTFKSFLLAGAPTYGEKSAVGTVTVGADSLSYFSIRKYSSNLLTMGSIVSLAEINFKETTLALTNNDEMKIGSGLIYCGDWRMFPQASDFTKDQTAVTFDSGKDA